MIRILALCLSAVLASSSWAADVQILKQGDGASQSYLPGTDEGIALRVENTDEIPETFWKAYRHVHIQGEIDLFDSVRLKQALRKLELADHVKAVMISIDSPGGLYLEAPRMIRAIRDYAAEHDVKVVTAAVGEGAWSAAAMVWLAGDVLQIVDGGAAVGFHAAYDPRDLSVAEELLPEIRGLIEDNFARMQRGGFRWKEDELAAAKVDVDFIGESISDYLELAFETKGASAFLVLDSDLEVDLWEAESLEKRTATWIEAAYTGTCLTRFLAPLDGKSSTWFRDADAEEPARIQATLRRTNFLADKSVTEELHWYVDVVLLPPQVLVSAKDGSLHARIEGPARIRAALPAWQRLMESEDGSWHQHSERTAYENTVEIAEDHVLTIGHARHRGDLYDADLGRPDVTEVDLSQVTKVSFGDTRVDGGLIDVRFKLAWDDEPGWTRSAELYFIGSRSERQAIEELFQAIEDSY